MEHTADCREMFAAAEAYRSEWVAKWLDYCRKCDGVGFIEYSGTYWEPPDVDCCPDCTDKGVCPRCGKQAWSETDCVDFPCRHCGWNPEEPDVCPEVPECTCVWAIYELTEEEV